MASDNFSSSARRDGHSLHAILAPFPLVCFIGALLTDVAYVRTYDIQWSNFSIWLLTAGLVTGVLAVLAGIIDAHNPRLRGRGRAWPHELGGIVALVLALLNAFVHSRDGYTSVVPSGITLSILTVIVMIVSNMLGAAMLRNARGIH